MKKFLLILGLLIIGAGVYGYFWYKNIQKTQLEANGVIDKANKYQSLQTAIDDENQRCQEFISQEEGDFGSFEYCKEYLKWSAPYIVR